MPSAGQERVSRVASGELQKRRPAPAVFWQGVSLVRDTTVLLEEVIVADVDNVDGADDALILHSGAVCPTIHMNVG